LSSDFKKPYITERNAIRYTDEVVYMIGDCVKVFEGTVEI